MSERILLTGVGGSIGIHALIHKILVYHFMSDSWPQIGGSRA